MILFFIYIYVYIQAWLVAFKCDLLIKLDWEWTTCFWLLSQYMPGLSFLTIIHYHLMENLNTHKLHIQNPSTETSVSVSR